MYRGWREIARAAVFCALVVSWCGVSAAASFTGEVKTVESAVTLSVVRNGAMQSVRLYGVRAPGEGHRLYHQARQFTLGKAFGKTITAHVIFTSGAGEIAALVKLPGGESLNEALAASGLGWWDMEEAGESTSLRDAEARARAERLGIWADPAQAEKRPGVLKESSVASVDPAKGRQTSKTLRLKGNASYYEEPEAPAIPERMTLDIPVETPEEENVAPTLSVEEQRAMAEEARQAAQEEAMAAQMEREQLETQAYLMEQGMGPEEAAAIAEQERLRREEEAYWAEQERLRQLEEQYLWEQEQLYYQQLYGSGYVDVPYLDFAPGDFGNW